MPSDVADMTDTIVSFADPLLAMVPPTNAEELERLFDRVIDIWNMWVASAPPWNDSRGLDEARAAMEKGEMSDAEIHIHRILAERWVTAFRSDGRLVINHAVTIEDGVPTFRCVGCEATTDLLDAFRGLEN